MNEMKKKYILISISVLLIVGISIFIILKYTSNKNKKIVLNTTETYEQYIEDKVIPNRAILLIDCYVGNLDRNEFYKSLYKLVHNLPEIIDGINLTDDDVEKYYISNKELINDSLGIEKKKDFEKMAEYLKRFSNIGKYKTSKIIDGTLEDSQRYFKFNISCVFEGSDNKETEINFKVFFSNSNLINPVIYYKAP